MFDRTSRKIIDGPNLRYRCYAASMEAAYPSLRNLVDENLRLLKEAKTVEGMTELITNSLPAFYFDKIRIHQDGDFFNMDYLRAWIAVAKSMPQRLFYAYTKSLQLWTRVLDDIPPNLVLNASRGGMFDSLIEKHDLKNVTVAFHPEEAAAKGLPVDHDDSLAMNPHVHAFALLLHGTQPSGSEASAAIKRMKQEGVKFSYGKGDNEK